MFRGLIVLLAVVGVATVVFSQGMIVRKGEVTSFSGGSEIQGLIFDLAKSEDWAAAKTKLVARGSGDDRIEVIYHLEKFQARQSSDEVIQTRVAAVLGELEQAGQYPLTEKDVTAEVKALTASLKKVGKGETSGEITREVLYSLVQARKQVDRAQKMIDTGEVPHEPGAMPRVRRVGPAGN